MAPVTRKSVADKLGSEEPVAAEPPAPKIPPPRRGVVGGEAENVRVVNLPSPPKRALEKPKEEEKEEVTDDEVIDVEDYDEKCRMIRIIIRALRAELGVKKEKRSKTVKIKQEPSPNCKQWNTVLKLKDPVRFASFMEGSSHLIDDEILEYETSHFNVDISDDDDDEEQDEATPTARYRKFAAQRSATNGRVPAAAAGGTTSTPTTARPTIGGRSSRSRSRQPVPTAPPRNEIELSDDED
ncbi:hypothetical protein quinque_014276 [Culex quinquefasciatus]